MRRWFVLFLICLLPLRAWAGDVMAVQMSQNQAIDQVAHIAAPEKAPAATAPIQVSAPETSTDCHGQMKSSGGDWAAESNASSGEHGPAPECAKCIACDLCHATGVATSEMAVGHVSVHGQHQPAKNSAFGSADFAAQFKPPIL